ncbi:MAG: DNA-binding response regulator [Candidatus Margulisbacteria bacterium GWF2_35_9]|nr:MAG: DNA-binding response regulator [Candidatus Margulisbacteria bacterium GWF2_35_9]
MNILVIEDEKKIAHFITRGLKEEGYAVSIANTGEQGLHLTTLTDYDLIILDIMLPEMDGIDVCKKFRETNTSTPIIMLTAKDEVKDRVKGLDSGANDYMTKPFAFEELLARIRVHHRTNNPSNKAIVTKLEVADLSLNFLDHQVTRNGNPIELTSREFSLLEYLMHNSGKIVTRTMILEHVWDINFDTETNVIDVHINHLRQKIDQHENKKLIHTVRGRGYILHD